MATAVPTCVSTEAQHELDKILGTCIWTVRSRTERVHQSIKVLVVDGAYIRDVSMLVSRVLELPMDERYGGVVVTGFRFRDLGARVADRLAERMERPIGQRWL